MQPPEINKQSESGQYDAQLAAAQEVLRVSEARYRAAFETSLDAIAICRIDNGMFVDVNRAFYEVLGYTREELVGQTSVESYTWVTPDGFEQNQVFIDLAGISTKDLSIWPDPESWDRLTTVVKTHGNCRDYETDLKTKSGKRISVVISAAYLELEEVPCLHFVVRDMSTHREAEDKIRHLSYFDTLTSLPNRDYILEYINLSLAKESLERQYHAFLQIKLNRMGDVARAYGLPVSEQLLCEAAKRILGQIRDKVDKAARIATDRFAILLYQLGDTVQEAQTHAMAIALRVRDSMSQPYRLKKHKIVCPASIGVTVFQAGDAEANCILRQSSIALAEAKCSDQNIVSAFDPKLQEAVQRRAELETELRYALDHEQFCLYYQPQYSEGQCVGAEALIRWIHPTRGVLAPALFLEHAELIGLMPRVDAWVLDAVCRQVAEWSRHKALPKGFRIAINVNASQFRLASFPGDLMEAIRRYGIDTRYIELELTETALVDEIQAVAARMDEIREQGIRISLDDFGTGYSCLSYLRQLPLDKIKIDLSFVRELLINKSSSAIVKAIISLGDALGLAVIAEGVETKLQQDCLIELGCRQFQGYLFSRPIPPSEFEMLFLKTDS